MSLLYKSISFADSPLSLTASGVDAINQNQNALVLDINASGGAIVINLPSITSLMFGSGASLSGAGALRNGAFVGGGAMSFYINGNRTAGANPITINAYNVNTPSEVDQDNICGQASATIGLLVGTCFHLFISGRHSWCILQCVPQLS